MGRLLYYGFSQNLMGLCSKSSAKKIIKGLQNQLRTEASKHGLCSISSIQVEGNIQMFALLNESHLKEGRWRNYRKMRQNNYQIICNPDIQDFSRDQESDWEECGSYPGIRMKMKRPIAIKWIYMNEKLTDYGPDEVTGFKARVIQHEVDHFQGKDFLRQAEDLEIIDPELKEKYSTQLKQLHSQFRGSITENIDSQFDNPFFRRLKQMVVYSIVDEMKGR